VEHTDRSIEVSTERNDGASTVVRLSRRVPAHADGSVPTTDELVEAYRSLASALDALVGRGEPSTPPPRTDRELTELLLVYRPKQPELIELLRSDGEITETEYRRLRAHLESSAPSPPTAAAPPASTKAIAPSTAAPLPIRPEEPSRVGGAKRPVEELMRIYQIETLKQAGAVRSRRAISFEEYMALKRHFEGSGSRRPPADSAAD